jgi:hypothetical protein
MRIEQAADERAENRADERAEERAEERADDGDFARQEAADAPADRRAGSARRNDLSGQI